MKIDRVYIDKEWVVRMSPDRWPTPEHHDQYDLQKIIDNSMAFEDQELAIKYAYGSKDSFVDGLPVNYYQWKESAKEKFYTIEPVEVEIIDACNNESCPNEAGCEHCQRPVKVARILTKVEQPKDGWIPLIHGKMPGYTSVRLLLTDGSELEAYSQFDGDFWSELMREFITPEKVTHWKPSPHKIWQR